VFVDIARNILLRDDDERKNAQERRVNELARKRSGETRAERHRRIVYLFYRFGRWSLSLFARVSYFLAV